MKSNTITWGARRRTQRDQERGFLCVCVCVYDIVRENKSLRVFSGAPALLQEGRNILKVNVV